MEVSHELHDQLSFTIVIICRIVVWFKMLIYILILTCLTLQTPQLKIMKRLEQLTVIFFFFYWKFYKLLMPQAPNVNLKCRSWTLPSEDDRLKFKSIGRLNPLLILTVFGI